MAQTDTHRKGLQSIASNSSGGLELIVRQHRGWGKLSGREIWDMIDTLDSSELNRLVENLKEGQAFRIGDVAQLDASGNFATCTIERLLDWYPALGMTAVVTMDNQEDPRNDYAVSLRGARLIQSGPQSIDNRLADQYKVLSARKESR